MSTHTEFIPTDTQQKRAWFRYQLALRGYTVKGLANTLGVNINQLSNVFAYPYPTLERQIATMLALEPWDIWPERYDTQGNPNRKVGRPKKCVSTHSNNIITEEPAHVS